MTDNILCAAEFAALGQQIGLLGSLVDDMDLEGFQRTTQRAETIGAAGWCLHTDHPWFALLLLFMAGGVQYRCRSMWGDRAEDWCPACHLVAIRARSET